MYVCTRFQEMTDLAKFEPRPNSEDMYAWSCKCFQQAKTLYESLPNPNEEVLLTISCLNTFYTLSSNMTYFLNW